jgi:hypothetical protein
VTTDILFAALAALVVSNILLLVAAARGGAFTAATRARHSDQRHGTASRRRARPSEARPVASITPIGPAPGDRAPGPSVDRSSAAETVSGEVSGPGPAEALSAFPGPSDGGVAIKDRAAADDEPANLPSAPGSVTAASGTRQRARPVRGGGAKRGRRFTLPPIDVDHARTERVMLSLLSSDDEAQGQMVDVWERLVGTDAGPGAAGVAAVVALTLEGLDRLAEASGRDAAERAVGATLDAIRRCARASDRVASIGRGHFRVLLVDADAAVAARFVTRVRDAADRRLTVAGSTITLAAGWAEAANAGRLEGAVHAAEDHRRRESAPLPRSSGEHGPA